MAGIDSYRDAISGIESSGRYNLLGPVTRDGDRAYGKYQIMGKNVGPWTREVLGREMSPQEFAADPAAQDAVFNAKFGGYVSKYGPEGAARAWFAGEGGMNDPNRKDVLGTSVAQYARKFNTAIGAPQGGGSPAPQGGSQMNPLLLMQNEQTQEQPQQGGLLGGLFNDPGKMAALQLLMSGLNPFSKGNEMEPFIRAAQLKATQDYNRKIDERDYNLRVQQFDLNRADKEADNKRADEAAKRAEKNAGLTEAAKDLIAQGYVPGTPEYIEAYKKYWQNKTTDKRNIGLNTVWGTKDGKPAIGQLSSTGELVETKLPEGFQPSKGLKKMDLGDSWAYVEEQTGQTVRIVPKNIEAKEAAEERGKAQGLAQAELPVVEITAARTIKQIDDFVNSKGFSEVFGAIDQFRPNWTMSDKGRESLSQFKQLSGRAFLEGRTLLKGGGAITDFESAKAEAAIARLERSLNEQDAKMALKDFQDAVREGVAKLRAKAGTSGTSAASSAPSATTGLSPGTYVWDGSKLVRQ